MGSLRLKCFVPFQALLSLNKTALFAQYDHLQHNSDVAAALIILFIVLIKIGAKECRV